jgi:predicted O-methyltransferase YrrM
MRPSQFTIHHANVSKRGPSMRVTPKVMRQNKKEYEHDWPISASNRTVPGKTGRQIDIGGASTLNNLRTIASLLEDTNAKRTLEIGLGVGASALVFARHHQRHEASAGAHTAIDPYQETNLDSAGLLTLESAGLRHWLDFRPGFSSIELAKALESGECFDFIYIDGSHIFDDVFVDLYFSSRLLTDNGLLAFDDCAKRHVAKVISYVRSHMRHCMHEIDLSAYRDDNPLIYRMARFFNRVQMRIFRKTGTIWRNWEVETVSF